MNSVRAAFVASVVFFGMPALAADPDANAGAKLVQTHGCSGCHGAQFEGGSGPKLNGVEKRLTSAQITSAIDHPKAPMPQYGFTSEQTADIVAYLSNLDGGARNSEPVATLSPDKPTGKATLSVKFPGTPPKKVTALPTMQMGTGTMTDAKVELAPASDPHVFTGVVHFSMGGPWTIVVTYDGKKLNVPVNVSGSM
jgi:cytochrome c553